MENNPNSSKQAIKKHRIIKVGALTLLVCFFVLICLVMFDAAFKPYKRSLGRIAELEDKVQSLNNSSHSKLRIRAGNFRISTTDKAIGSNDWQGLRLAYGTNDVQKFEDTIFK